MTSLPPGKCSSIIYVHLEEPFCTFLTTTVSNQVMWTRYCNIFGITIFFFLCFKDVECVFVETTYGWIQGNVTQHAIVFLGVPFAQPPKRWEDFFDRKKISIRITSKVKIKSFKKNGQYSDLHISSQIKFQFWYIVLYNFSYKSEIYLYSKYILVNH